MLSFRNKASIREIKHRIIFRCLLEMRINKQRRIFFLKQASELYIHGILETYNADNGKAIGIDPGTNYNCVGIWHGDHKRVDIAANANE